MNWGTDLDHNESWLKEAWLSFRLALALLWDKRVSTAAKLIIPALWLLYLISPVDLIPDVLPVIGQVDDLAVLLLGVRMFIALAPDEVVREHWEKIVGARAGKEGQQPSQETIEGEWRIIE